MQFKDLQFNMLLVDSSVDSRAISVDVGSPSEIKNLFDSITYSKVLKKIIYYLELLFFPIIKRVAV